MKTSLIKLVAKLLREIADKLDSGNSELSESEAMDIMSLLTHHVMSKETACNYLNMSRSKFDSMINLNKLPKGRKRVGFKELVWYKEELSDYITTKKK